MLGRTLRVRIDVLGRRYCAGFFVVHDKSAPYGAAENFNPRPEDAAEDFNPNP